MKKASFLVSALFLVFVASTNASEALYSFEPTGSMAEGRYNPVAVRLLTGEVLVTGGESPIRASAELYDPSIGTWSYVGNMTTTRNLHTATLLNDGRVLIVGGYDISRNLLNSVEIYDPDTKTFQSAAVLNVTRKEHVAVKLQNGKVLVAGGSGNNKSTEIYDPDKNTWTRVGDLNNGRSNPTINLLMDGRVLVSGGVHNPTYLDDAELYDPETESWHLITSKMQKIKSAHSSVLLPDGKVIITGGWDHRIQQSIADVEIFNPTTGALIPGTGKHEGQFEVVSDMEVVRASHITEWVPGLNKVLVAGGNKKESGDWLRYSSAELYDPDLDSWTTTGEMSTARRWPTSVLLKNGCVLVLGGNDDASVELASAELYSPQDSDGDGVPDDEDLCPDTEAEAAVDSAGCSISQLCPTDSDWKNHGKYVSCIATEADLFFEASLITEEEKDAIVSEAAQSSVGQKDKTK